MNTKNIKQFLLAGMVSCGMAASFTACSDWNDHYENAAEGGAASGTLWQQLKANPQLSDFCEVLEQTKVYRMHKKTPVSYADLLNSGQAFTVMAPVNNSFNKDSLLQLVQTVAGDSSVEKSFVQNHIVRSMVSSGPYSVRMLMMNLKYQDMVDGKVEGVPVTLANNKTISIISLSYSATIPSCLSLAKTCVASTRKCSTLMLQCRMVWWMVYPCMSIPLSMSATVC